MSSWEELDGYLEDLARRLGGVAYLFADSGKLKLSPPGEQAPELMERFERACAIIRETFGADCLGRGTWRRLLHHEAGSSFVAEPVLLAYHLIVVFPSEYTADEWVFRVLDRARPILAEIVSGLPPIDGGGRGGEMAKVS